MASAFFRSAAILTISSLMTLAGGWRPLLAAPILTALYDPANGNITMQAFENGEPASLNIGTFQFVSPALYLSGVAASIPGSANAGFTVLNTSQSTIVNPPSVHSEIYATSFPSATALFTGTWNLGNVATVGLTQSQIASGFTTDPDSSPGGVAVPGHFLYQVQDGDFFTGQITAVPEPSSVFLIVSVGLATGAWNLLRRRPLPR